MGRCQTPIRPFADPACGAEHGTRPADPADRWRGQGHRASPLRRRPRGTRPPPRPAGARPPGPRPDRPDRDGRGARGAGRRGRADRGGPADRRRRAATVSTSRSPGPRSCGRASPSRWSSPRRRRPPRMRPRSSSSVDAARARRRPRSSDGARRAPGEGRLGRRRGRGDSRIAARRASAAAPRSSPRTRPCPATSSGGPAFRRGDIDAALAASDVVVEGRFTTSWIHQGYIEPQVAHRPSSTATASST